LVSSKLQIFCQKFIQLFTYGRTYARVRSMPINPYVFVFLLLSFFFTTYYAGNVDEQNDISN